MQLHSESRADGPVVLSRQQQASWCGRLATAEGQHAIARQLATALARADDTASAARAFADAVAGRCCDWSAVACEPLNRECVVEIAAARHVPLRRLEPLRQFLDGEHTAELTAHTAQRPRLVRHVDSDVVAAFTDVEDDRRMLAGLPLRSMVLMPIPAVDAPGILVLGSTSDRRPFRARHLLFLRELSSDFGATLDRLTRIRKLTTDLERRDSLFEGVAHDLRNPLNVVLLAVEALSAGSVPPERQPRHLDAIRSSALYMNDLIAGLLAATRGTDNGASAAVRPADIARRITETQMPLARSRGVYLRLSADESVPESAASAQAIARVLWNLIDNAVRASTTGGVVTVTVRRAGYTVEFTVTNSGPGLDSTRQEEAFRPHWSGRKREGGLGLGLGIARQIVQDNEGSIWVRSSADGPTTFGFRLPLASVDTLRSQERTSA